MLLNVERIVKKLKDDSKNQSKIIKFQENYNCLYGDEHQKECNIYVLRSINQKMFLQEFKKSTLSKFNDKRCYIIETESIPWN